MIKYLSAIEALVWRREMSLIGSTSFGFAQNTIRDFQIPSWTHRVIVFHKFNKKHLIITCKLELTEPAFRFTILGEKAFENKYGKKKTLAICIAFFYPVVEKTLFFVP